MNKEEVEKIVFKKFLKVSPFKNLIQIDSIKNCKPQKPDIYCLDKNKNEYYFELVEIVEIVDQGMAQSISNLISFPSFFQEQLNKLHSTKQKLFNRINSNASFHFYFKNGVTKAIIRKHFQTIIEELIGLDKKYKGKYEIRSLINIIKYIRIKRYNFNITSFNRVSAGSYGDP